MDTSMHMAAAQSSAGPQPVIFSAPASPASGQVPVASGQPAASIRTRLGRSFRALKRRERLTYSLVAVAALTVGLAFAGINGGFFRGEVYKDTATLSVQAPVRVIAAGETIEVSVHLNSGGEKVGGVTAELAYDAEYMEPVDATPGDESITVKSSVYKENEVKAFLDPKRLDQRTQTERPAVVITGGNLSLVNSDAMDKDVFAVSFKALRDTPQTKIELLFQKGSTRNSHVSQYLEGEDLSTDVYELLNQTEDLLLQITPASGGATTSSPPPQQTSPIPSASSAPLPEPSLPPPAAGAGLTAALRASPDAVSGSRVISITMTLTSTAAIPQLVVMSAEAKDGVVERGGATIEYEDGSERVTPTGILVSGSMTRGGLTLENVPAGTTTLELRASASGEALAAGSRVSIVDTLRAGDAAASYKVAIRSDATPTPAVTPSSAPTTPSVPPVPTPVPTPIPSPSAAPSTTPPQGGSVAGGSSSAKGNTPPPAPAQGGSAPVGANGPFPDVPASHPAAAAIRILKDRGALEGYDPGRFGPGALLTRAELAKVLVRAKGQPPLPAPQPIPDADPANFPGDPNYQAFHSAISTAVAQGWIPLRGTAFEPWVAADAATIAAAFAQAGGNASAVQGSGPISRADFCIALVRALGL